MGVNKLGVNIPHGFTWKYYCLIWHKTIITNSNATRHVVKKKKWQRMAEISLLLVVRPAEHGQGINNHQDQQLGNEKDEDEEEDEVFQ